VQPLARPIGEGSYVIARHDGHPHLAYRLELRGRPGAPQRDLHVEPEASYIVSVKNPQVPSPPGIGRPRTRHAAAPPLSWSSLERRATPPRELDLDLDGEVEKAARHTIFEDQRIGRQDRPVESLFAGRWR
jgi:hypothetical protein